MVRLLRRRFGTNTHDRRRAADQGPGPTAASEAACPPAPLAAAPRSEAVPAAPAPVPSLRSLTRYQYDPAFSKFQEKLHRAPGSPPRRARLDDATLRQTDRTR